MKWMGYVVMVMIFMCSAATADTLNVPTDFETIQAAIDAAVDGDIVLIADGVYSGPGNVNLDPLGKAISIRSAQDSPDKCIIDCDHENRAFTITKGETQETIIRGLTISNGKAPSSISDGGAIYCYQSGPTISDCIFRNCTAGELNFSSYQSVGNGGAIWIAKTQAAIERCRFINCKAGYSGGAVSLSKSTITITECEFRDNQCEVNGGAIQSSGSSINVEKSLFTNNDASLGYGGAILLSLTTAFIKENTFQSNNAIHGGAIYNSFSTSVIGGTLDDGNVFTGNSAGIGADLFTSETPEPVNARFNTFMSHQDSDYSFENRTNFDFTDCQFLLVPITQPVYVSSTGSDNNDGLSSETPFRTIHHAISRVRPSADNPITIYLDEGTYSPETNGERFPLPMLSNLTISGAGPYKTILSANSTSLVFYLANEKAALIEGVSIQDGHGDAGGGVFAINSSFQMTNCEISHCIAGSGAGVKAINSSGLFKHVHITDNASSEGGNSACINSEDGSLIFIQSTLARNTSDMGAIIFTSNNSITMIGCLIEDNTNLSESMCGGAFHCHGSLHLADCQILDNYANCMSAIINHGDTALENCLIAGNKNRLNSSFINLNQGETRIQHCTIADHSLENDFNTVVNITGTELLMRDTIIWNNAEEELRADSSMADVSYCNIKGGYPGEGNIDSIPQFTSCAFSEYYLSDGTNGHPLSPCIDSGSDLASNITYEQISNSINMDEWTADSSWSSDVGMVDMGFHWNHSFYNGVKLDLSETLFYPGDTFSLVTAVINHSDETWDNACLFVALEIEGSYWLAPSWQPASHGIDYYTLSLFNGDHTVIPVLEAFSWPEGLGTLSGIAFHGLLTDTAIVSLLGEMDTVYFGYTE